MTSLFSCDYFLWKHKLRSINEQEDFIRHEIELIREEMTRWELQREDLGVYEAHHLDDRILETMKN